MTLRTVMAILAAIAVGVLAWMAPPVPRRTIRLDTSEEQPFTIHTISSDGRFVLGETFTDQQVDSFMVVWDLDNNSKPLLQHIPPAGTQRTEVNEFSPDGRSLLCVSLGLGTIHFRVFDLQTGRVKSEGELDNDGRGFPFFAKNGRLINRRQHTLFDLASGEKIAELPERDAEFSWSHNISSFEMYRKKQFWRVYSSHTGELVAQAELPSEKWDALVASEDGRVVVGILHTPASAGKSDARSCKLIDTRSGICRFNDELANAYGPGTSPDGRTLLFYDRAAKLSWIRRVWSWSETEGRVRLVRWSDDEELRTFHNVTEARFSPDGNLFVVQSGNSLAVYDFPFRKPWRLIFGSALSAACCFWFLARLWSRRFGRKPMVA